MITIIDKVNKTNSGGQALEIVEGSVVSGEEKAPAGVETTAKSAENILSSLKEKALLLDHLKSKSPTNSEIEKIKADLEKTIEELEALNV